MTSVIGEWALALCAAAAVCAAALALCPEGKVKRVLRTVCGGVMVLALVSPAARLDIDAYASAIARGREEAAAVTGGAEETKNSLERAIIESECAAYILDKAGSLGASVSSAAVGARWDEAGCWVPYSAQLIAGSRSSALARAIETELGIPEERQSWEVSG